MSQIMKSFLGVFILLLLMASSGGILSAYLQVLSVQHTHARIINELENSNYNSKVMEACFKEAKAEGCSLNITLFTLDGEICEVKEENTISSNPLNVEEAEVIVEFPYRIVFFAMNQSHSISGYAR